MIRFILVTLATLLTLACGYPRAPEPTPPSLAQSDYNEMWFFAARHLECPADAIHYTPVAVGRHLFTGCGRTVEMLVGRDTGATYARASATNRFSKEAGCPVGDTTEEEVDLVTHVVTGCGHRMTYLFDCSQLACTWVANASNDARPR